jgi:hypothetical protein
MKKIITLGMVLLAFSTAFKNKSMVLTDCRDTYIGAYLCKRICVRSNYLTKQNDFNTDTTIITISKADEDSVLNINLNDQDIKVKLNGKYLQAFSMGHFGGEFYSTDSIDFSYSQMQSITCRYLGKKE